MTTAALVLVPLALLWGVLTLIVLVMDRRERRYYTEQLETRAWREKVDAMRRMHDEDGAA
jgi:uncharacterized membrane protein affecting hemolysin expression